MQIDETKFVSAIGIMDFRDVYQTLGTYCGHEMVFTNTYVQIFPTLLTAVTT